MDFTLASSELGRVVITRDAIVQIVGLTAAECYGVVGQASAGKLGRLLVRDRTGRGIEIQGGDDELGIAIHVVVERGLNLAEVAATVRNRVTYEVERMTGIAPVAVDVHIESVRESA